jgi:hypothetical protein
MKAESQPTILPKLQNQGVISVVLGDYHFGALTASGKLFTWGKYILDYIHYALLSLQVNTPREPWAWGTRQISSQVNQVAS